MGAFYFVQSCGVIKSGVSSIRKFSYLSGRGYLFHVFECYRLCPGASILSSMTMACKIMRIYRYMCCPNLLAKLCTFCHCSFPQSNAAGGTNAFGSSVGTTTRSPSPFGGGTSGFGAPSALGGGGVFGSTPQATNVPPKVWCFKVLLLWLKLILN